MSIINITINSVEKTWQEKIFTFVGDFLGTQLAQGVAGRGRHVRMNKHNRHSPPPRRESEAFPVSQGDTASCSLSSSCRDVSSPPATHRLPFPGSFCCEFRSSFPESPHLTLSLPICNPSSASKGFVSRCRLALNPRTLALPG